GPALLPTLMVEVLLSPGRIDPGCLQVPQWIGADPDLPPGGRDCQLLDSHQRLGIADPLPVRVTVGETPASSKSRDAVGGAVRTAQSPTFLHSARHRHIHRANLYPRNRTRSSRTAKGCPSHGLPQRMVGI